jgi:hypothetical protein
MDVEGHNLLWEVYLYLRKIGNNSTIADIKTRPPEPQGPAIKRRRLVDIEKEGGTLG